MSLPANTHTIDLTISGMSCASCVGRVERTLQRIEGVSEANVNLATNKAHVTLNRTLPTDLLIQAIEKAGYGASPITTDQPINDDTRQKDTISNLTHALIIAVIGTLPIFIVEMGGHIFPPFHHFINHTLGQQNSWLIQWFLATAVILLAGLSFYKKGLKALYHLAPDMNSLVALGTLAAYGYSVVATFTPNLLPEGTVHVYYEAATVIICLILLGRLLEAKTKGKTSEAIKRLMHLQVNHAHVYRDGTLVDIPIEAVHINDLLAVQPGERIPVDGIVSEGESYVDESMITGEPLPVHKIPDAQLVAGTINQKGHLTLKATKIGSDTLLAQIIHMVEQAQGSKLPIQAAIDKITRWFVPIIIGLSLLTFLLWLILGHEHTLSFAIINAVTVLIVACPCAMGLATPVSIMVSTGRAAQLGILIRQGEALQTLKNTRSIVLDKTGTLTKGEPTLTDLVIHNMDKTTALQYLASLEAKSEHPLAQAVVKEANKQSIALLPVEQFESITGQGIKGHIQHRNIYIGTADFMQQHTVSVQSFAEQATTLAKQAKTPFYMAVDGQLAAMVAVSDPIKPTTPEAINAFHQLGLNVTMLTGDNQQTAQAIASQLAIDHVIAEVLPTGKIEAISTLKKQGCLTYVGDGINDAPALVEADVGIAIGTGTDIAIEAADVVLISGDLTAVTKAIRLSKATMANIHQNIFWAFAYNVILIPIAMGALYPFTGLLLSPMLAAGAMTLSSLFVLTNALRLKRFA